jgi:hypothetical protein
MIQPIDNSSGRLGTAESGGTRARASTGASFAAEMAKAQAADTSTTSDPSGTVDTTLKPPKGETWGPVPGHSDYADILTGPRNGYFVSLAPGPRQGKAFLIVQKNGQTYHVYGSGKSKQWIPVPTDPNALKPPKGETWKPVEHHHDYKQISGGKRDDMFVNLSGNKRTGEAFTVEHRDGKTVHVYGSGKDRHEVTVGGHKKKG